LTKLLAREYFDKSIRYLVQDNNGDYWLYFRSKKTGARQEGYKI